MNKTFYFSFLDQSNLDLAIKELSNFTKIIDDKNSPFVLTEVINYKNLAFTKYYGLFLGEYASLDELDLSNLKNKKVLLRIKGNRKETKVIQEKLSKKFSFKLYFPDKYYKRALNNDYEDILIYYKGNSLLLGKVLWKRPSFIDREPINRPFNRPYSLKPKFARALINLANDNFIVDPFLGTGTIIIEAHFMDKDYLGLDKDWKAIKGASENFDYFNLKRKIVLSDALYINKLIKKEFSVVTDPPYGKSSTLFKSKIEELYKNFIENFLSNDYSKKLVIIAPKHQKSLIDIIYSYNPKFRIDHRVNSSLIRSIFLIENNC